jgi:CHAD domain-containing protein
MQEIEAKFVLPDTETLERLQAVEQLAGYRLSTGRTTTVHDTYYDTSDRTVLAAGFSYRQRKQNDRILVTLKSVERADDAVHRRDELEIEIESDLPPSSWKRGMLRDWVLWVMDQNKLLPLFELHQTRTVRPLRQGRFKIAEMSLDRVEMTTGKRVKTYAELEIELTSRGGEDDLAKLTQVLQDDWNLVPETRSKFERALLLVERSKQRGQLLNPSERVLLDRIAGRTNMYGARARALLAVDQGLTQTEAGEKANRSARRVRYWLATFRKQRMSVFPAKVLEPITPPTPSELAERLPEMLPKPTTEAPPAKPEPSRPSSKPDRPKKPRLPKKPGLKPDDTMPEAARKTLFFHFTRMLHHEPGTRQGDDIEELHDMRVATRRMRAALQVFGDYIDMKEMAPFAKGLRRTGRSLGAVRDLDVFWEKTQKYLETLPPNRQDDLEPLRVVWAAERKEARERMLSHLDSDRYTEFRDRFVEFLKTPGGAALPAFSKRGEPQSHRLRYIVPIAVYQRLASVHAYREYVTGNDVPLERLHQLRIDAKRLRYTLEYFREILGPETKSLIQEMRGLQDHLGDLQDAVVASSLLRDFLTWGTWGHADRKNLQLPPEPVVAPGVAAYMTFRQMELQRLIDTFPVTWKRIQAPEFSQLVTGALSVL